MRCTAGELIQPSFDDATRAVDEVDGVDGAAVDEVDGAAVAEVDGAANVDGKVPGAVDEVAGRVAAGVDEVDAAGDGKCTPSRT